jgi:hypothetical protein
MQEKEAAAMTKPITGQYECQHSSGIGLDYFTSRIDRLILQPDGHFTLTIQERSRLSNAAQSLVSGQQITNAAPEKKREGTYSVQDSTIIFHFQDGTQEQGQLSWNGEGLQWGQDFFNKVSDSTLLPSTHRLQKDMDDIAKGIKIATTVGSIALKAAKTIHGTLQSTQNTDAAASPAGEPVQRPAPQPVQQPPQQPAAQPVRPAPPPPQPIQGQMEALFCDQCGARSRPGKKFCGNCGARLA